MTKTVDYYFTIPSPWAYLAGPRFYNLTQRNNLVVNWKPIDLFQAFALVGTKKVSDRAPQIRANRLTELARWGDYLDMPINIEPKYFPPNPEPANRMVIAAVNKECNLHKLVEDYMSAVWVQEEDISKPSTVIRIANRNGLNGEELYDFSQGIKISEQLDRNTEEAISRNVFGAPTWIFEGELFWGQDRIDFLTRAIEK